MNGHEVEKCIVVSHLRRITSSHNKIENNGKIKSYISWYVIAICKKKNYNVITFIKFKLK